MGWHGGVGKKVYRGAIIWLAGISMRYATCGGVDDVKRLELEGESLREQRCIYTVYIRSKS